MMNILVIDDEKEIADLIEIYLKNENYQVYKFYDSKNITKFLEEVKIDLAILDVMLPGQDGFNLCQEIREKYNFPIIFVTAKITSMDKINGLALGADDYITKPFQPLELVARVKAQLRRYTKYNDMDNSQDDLFIRDLKINNQNHKCTLNGEVLELTKTEFNILWYLCINCGKVVKTDELFKAIWQDEYYTALNNTIMVHIRHLREKMHDTTKEPKYIKTVWGVGYIIDE